MQIIPALSGTSGVVADLLSASDYYGFGSLMPGRSFTSATGYRYGMNGQEKDDEIAGDGNLTTAKFWEYDTRLAIRWNLDPKPVAFWSPYAVFYGMPIKLNDPDGDCPPVLLIIALIMTADALDAPTLDYADNGRKMEEARKDHDMGILVNMIAPGAGAIAEKYVVKTVITKVAPVFVKKTEEAIAKQVESKVVDIVAEKQPLIFERAMSKAELKNMKETGILRGNRANDMELNYFTDKINSNNAGSVAKKYGLDYKPEVKVKFEIKSSTKVVKTEGGAKPGRLGKGGGTEYTTKGKTEIKIISVKPFKK